MNKSYLPQHVVTETLGWCDFTGSDQDVYLAESLASQQYRDMDDLIDTMTCYIDNKKRLKEWKINVEAMKTHKFFMPYFKSK